MRNMTGFYYTLRIVVWRIFAYLQETVVHEFTSLLPASEHVELLDSKRNRINLSSKHVTVELIFFVICVFLIVLIILSLKCSKNEEESYEEEEDEEVQEDFLDSTYKTNRMVESSGSSVCSIPHQRTQSKDDKFVRRDCGDSALIPQIQEAFDATNCAHSAGCSKTPSGLVRETTGYFNERQQVQRKVNLPKHICRSTNKQQHCVKIADCEWFIRRTRSGQIYGKYPL